MHLSTKMSLRYAKRSLFTPEQRDHLKRKLPGPPPPGLPEPEDSQETPRIGPATTSRRSSGNKAIDLTGQQFGRWTVIKMTGRLLVRGKPVGQSVWECHCECGNIKTEVLYNSLIKRTSTSCGCFQKELMAKGRGSRYDYPREYRIWQGMKTRCYNPNHFTFARYGAKGILMQASWCESFKNFIADMGPCPPDKWSIDRKDGTQGYSKENCRWATTQEQADNKVDWAAKPWMGDMKGKRFGLLLIGDVHRQTGHQYIWKAQCDCGNSLTVLHRHLANGHARSCGCHRGTPMSVHTPDTFSASVKRPDIALRSKLGTPTKDLTGQKFGRWTVLGPSGKAKNMTLWNCQCSCGRKKPNVLYSSLTQGTSLSCGCLRSEELVEKHRKGRLAKLASDNFEM